MVTTPDLIKLLVADAAPVHRLRPPLIRAGVWLMVALPVATIVALAFGLRPDLSSKLQEPAFLLESGAAVLTGIMAAVAAFHVSLPDRSRLWLLLPLPTTLLWLSAIGFGCLANWVAVRPDALGLAASLRCLGTIVLTSVPLASVLLVMVRYAGPIRPRSTATAGAQAIAALTGAALRLFHPLDATALILIWNLGAAALIVALGGLTGRRLLLRVLPAPAASR